jgi:hypothetical protein
MTSGTTDCTVKYDQAGNANYNAATQKTETVTAVKADQTITITTHAPASKVFAGSFTVAATASSGLTVSFSSDGVCSNVGDTFTMTSGTGDCTVRYDQDGDDNYNAATQKTDTVTAVKADQAITITTHAPATKVYNTSFTVAATGGGSGNPVTFSSAGVCSNVGDTFTMTSGTGTCTVKYDQAGDANYNAAPQKTDTVTAEKADQAITITTHAPGSKVFGMSFTVAATGGGSGNPVTFDSAGGCSNSGATFTMTSGTTDCTVKYDQAGNANYNAATQKTETVTAVKADQTTLTVTSPNSGINGDKLTPATSGGSGSGAISFTTSGTACQMGTGPDAGKLLITSGTGACSITAHKAADANYNAADSAPHAVTIAKVTFMSPVDMAPIMNIAKLGRVVPVKANVFQNGIAVGQTGGPIYVSGFSEVSCTTGATTDAIDQYAAAGSSNTGNLFRWDTTGQFWIYNFDTSAFTMKQGNCYRINVNFGGVVSGSTASGGSLAGYFLLQTTK